MPVWGMLLARSAKQYIRVLSHQDSGLWYNTFYTKIVRPKKWKIMEIPFLWFLKTKFMYTIRGFLSNSINGNLIILSFFFLWWPLFPLYNYWGTALLCTVFSLLMHDLVSVFVPANLPACTSLYSHRFFLNSLDTTPTELRPRRYSDPREFSPEGRGTR